MKLLELYRSLLKAANMVATEDGYISNQFTDTPTPATIKGKRLVLPTQAHLSDPKPDKQIIFHPLSENMLREESVVLENYRNAINTKLRYTIGVLCMELLQLATSPAEHSKLTPDQSELLSKLKNADEKTLDVFKRIIIKMTVEQQQNVFVNIYLKRGGSIGGKKYHRVGVTSFPFYEELKKNDDVYGVKLRIKDREVLVNLMEYIFPEIATAEAYNAGTNSKVAPFIDALMKTVIAVASPINDTITLFKNIIDEPERLLIEDGWVETFDNLEVMLPEIRMIPMQAGNEGVVAGAQPNQQGQIIPPTPLAQPAQLPPQLMPNYQPQMYPNQVMQFQQPQAAGIVKTQDGLDFSSIERVVPGLASNNNRPMGFNLGAPAQRQPGWATPNTGMPMNYGNNNPQFNNSGWSNNQQPQYNNGGGYNNQQSMYGNAGGYRPMI